MANATAGSCCDCLCHSSGSTIFSSSCLSTTKLAKATPKTTTALETTTTQKVQHYVQFTTKLDFTSTTTEPNKPCDKNWRLIIDKCYFISNDKKSYSAAEFECIFKGAILFEPKNPLVESELIDYLNEAKSYWIGVNDLDQEGM